MPTDVDSYHPQTALLAAYLATQYIVKAEQLGINIRIGQHPETLRQLSTTTQPIDSWAIITACNPGSKIYSTAENSRQALGLKHQIEGLHYSYLSSRAESEHSDFPAEAGFFIQNIKPQHLHQLALDFGQNAVVVGDLSSAARLLIIPEVWKNLPAAINLQPFVDIYSPAIENTPLV